MNVNSITFGREQLQKVERLFFDQKNVLACTDQLFEIINNFPALTTDSLSAKSFCRLTGGIYSMKEHLPVEKQKKITLLFWSVHNIKPILIHNGLENREPVKNYIKQNHTNNALVEPSQDYPIPMSILETEEMQANRYLKSLLVLLNDETTVKISQGFLGYFSKMVDTMLKRDEMEEPNKLILEQVSRHQFDSMMAYLLTKEQALINGENALSLLQSAAYLQIPEIFEACKSYVMSHLDDELKFHLLNLLLGEEHKNAIFQIEKHISEIISAGLQETPVSPNFLKKMQSLKDILSRPIKVDLSSLDITDEVFGHLIGLPIRELQLLNCQKLTSKCFDKIKQIPSIKVLKLGGCQWVDDDALSKVPSNIEELSLSNCSNFTKKGLSSLQSTNVSHLELFSCKHLTDEDFTLLPDKFETLQVSLCKGIGKKAMKHFGGMSKLQDLRVARTPVDDECIFFLSKNLIVLDLTGCPITSACLTEIKQMHNLRNLSLSGMKIKDEELALLPESLAYLRLDRCTQLTNDGIIPLAKRQSLKYLGLIECRKVTQKAIDAFATTQIKVGWQELQPSHLSMNAFK